MLYNTIKWPYQPKHSPSYVRCAFSVYYFGTLCSHEAHLLRYVNKSYDLLCEQYYVTCATARICDIRKLRYGTNGVAEYHLQGSSESHVPWIINLSFKSQTTPIIFAIHMPYIVDSLFFRSTYSNTR